MADCFGSAIRPMSPTDTSFYGNGFLGASIMAARFARSLCAMPYADSSMNGIGGAPF